MKDEQDDVSIEPETGGEGEDAESSIGQEKAESKIAKMREELANCRKEKQEYMDGWQRAKADYVNLLRRLESEVKSSELLGKVKAVETLLPAFDALERAGEHGEIPAGFLAIARQLESAFAALGLEELGKVGEPFNPVFHEAFGQDMVEATEKDNTITAVLEKGWKINPVNGNGAGGTIIRPAKVRVGIFRTS